MKLKLFVAAFFAAGIFSAVAQSNPSSTNGVDIEMELPWPNGGLYFSSYNAEDYYFTTNVLFDWDQIDNDIYNWSETGGGNGFESIEYQGGPFTSSTNEYLWPGSAFPVWLDGIDITLLPGPSTNYNMSPPFEGASTYVNYVDYGSVYYNYNDFINGGEEIIQRNDYPQITLVTGGLPGTTGGELFGANATAQNIYPDGYNIPLQQISISSFGAMDAIGWAFAVLPSHSQVPITVSASDGYYQFYESVQPFQLVSQCVSPIPANQARTTIGVGEQVNLSFSPTLPTNAVWSTTAGSLSSITNTSTQFTAPSSPGSATVTAKVEGKSVTISYNVIAPSGIVTATIIGTNHYPIGWVGAGMTDLVTVYPTDVSFYQVELNELTASVTNVTGYFTNSTLSVNIGSTILSYSNTFTDIVQTAAFQPDGPLYPGGYDIEVPVNWQVIGSSAASYLNTFPDLVRLLDSGGDFSHAKYGISITRSTNDVSFSTQ